MWLARYLAPVHLLVCSLALTSAGSSWGFNDATISIQGKGSGVGAGFKERLAERKALSQPVPLGSSDTLKVLLTAQENKKGKRPHQAFLLFKDSDSGLETSYPFSVKESGKGKIEITHKDLPLQFLTSSRPLVASVVIASFGSSTPYSSYAFDLAIDVDTGAPIGPQEKPLRYGKLPEIHHNFKSDPQSPPKLITLVFMAAVIVALPVLLATWLSLGANFNHLSKALGNSPVSHILFYGSILAMEGIFFMYYTTWNLFQTLPAAIAIGSITFLSGSRCLTEVQNRRLAGLR